MGFVVANCHPLDISRPLVSVVESRAARGSGRVLELVPNGLAERSGSERVTAVDAERPFVAPTRATYQELALEVVAPAAEPAEAAVLDFDALCAEALDLCFVAVIEGHVVGFCGNSLLGDAA